MNGSNEQNAFLTEDFFDGNVIYRNGQEIAVDRDSTTVDPVEVNINSLTVGSWSVDAANDLLTFAMNDVNGTALAAWTGLSLKWSFTCANDSIEGFDNNTVPEPSMAALLGLGLLSVPIVRRRGQKHA